MFMTTPLNINVNLLSSLGFKLNIQRAPQLNFNVQSFELPSVSIYPVKQATPFRQVDIPQGSISFTPLSVEFLCDEQLENYFDIWNWITAIGNKDGTVGYAALAAMPIGQGLSSPITLMTEDNKHQNNVAFLFDAAYPTYLSPLQFRANADGVNYLTATASFHYSNYSYSQVITPSIT